VPPVDSEIAVHREDFGGAVNFREANEAGISQRHRPIAVAAHEGAKVRLLSLERDRDSDDPSFQHGKQSIGVAALAL